MSDLYIKTMHKLELDKILQMLSDCAGSEEGKAACVKLTPVTDPEDVQGLLDETTAAYQLCIRKSAPGFSGVSDVSASIERANMGGVLQMKELLAIGAVLRCAREVQSYCADDDEMTVLDPLFRSLNPNKYLENKIFGAILSESEMADSASTALSDIRRHIRLQSGKIKDSLQKIISSPSYAKFLRDPIITIRQGRYVVPVKSEHKNDVPGLVHDVSATGSTYFIEPISAVNANNALRELELREQKEIERILAELSADVSACHEAIVENFTLLVRLDVIFAKAKLSVRMNAWAPQINNEGVVDLKKARHPLIDPKVVVPISLHLGDDFDTMIITGPNTGGKTVALKTLGLLTLMAECGLHIPAGSGSKICVFEHILADIGDEQSIAQSLSTFSSHMRTIVNVIELCNDNTLVLFDELGAGTDPAEGAALAIALIEYCRKMGAVVAATTHYAELKLYAMRNTGVINASCEFDVETLQPTYKLLIGIPGKSNAFAISKKLGLPDSILKEANDLVGKNDRDFEEVLSGLEHQRKQMEKARIEAEQLRSEIERIKQKSQKYHDQLQQEREKALEQARLEAREIIEEARRAANAASDELKALKNQLMNSGNINGINQRQAELRRNLNEAQSKIMPAKDRVVRKASSRQIMIGDTVELIKLGTKANVIAINKDGSYELQAGVLKLHAQTDEIYLLEADSVSEHMKYRPQHSGRQIKMTSSCSEVDLRGMDSIEAVCVMERFLDEAFRSNLPSVRVIHGKGTGVLRTAVHSALKKNRFIKSYRLGLYGEGEDGVTIVEFK